MKYLIAPLLFLALNQPAVATEDKDVLRDACSGIKAPAKRSQCFGAIDRLVAPASAAPALAPQSAAPAALKPSLRGLQCEAFEFSELDSMPREELEGLYCSYSQGSASSTKISDIELAKYPNDPRTQVALLNQQVSFLGRCSRGMSKAREVFSRKHPSQKLDCSKLPNTSTESEAKAEVDTEASTIGKWRRVE